MAVRESSASASWVLDWARDHGDRQCWVGWAEEGLKALRAAARLLCPVVTHR